MGNKIIVVIDLYPIEQNKYQWLKKTKNKNNSTIEYLMGVNSFSLQKNSNLRNVEEYPKWIKLKKKYN